MAYYYYYYLITTKYTQMSADPKAWSAAVQWLGLRV